MKHVTAWVKVKIPVDMNFYSPQKLKNLIADAVDDGAADCEEVLTCKFMQATHRPVVTCGSCGRQIEDDLELPCWHCEPAAYDRAVAI